MPGLFLGAITDYFMTVQLRTIFTWLKATATKSLCCSPGRTDIRSESTIKNSNC